MTKTTTTQTTQPTQPTQPTNQPTDPTNQPELPSRSGGIRRHPGHCSPGQSSWVRRIQDLVV